MRDRTGRRWSYGEGGGGCSALTCGAVAEAEESVRICHRIKTNVFTDLGYPHVLKNDLQQTVNSKPITNPL